MISGLIYFTEPIVFPTIQHVSITWHYLYIVDLGNYIFLLLVFFPELAYKFLKVELLFPLVRASIAYDLSSCLPQVSHPHPHPIISSQAGTGK